VATDRHLITCYSCQEKGHIARNCPKGAFHCHKCGGSNHLARNCNNFLEKNRPKLRHIEHIDSDDKLSIIDYASIPDDESVKTNETDNREIDDGCFVLSCKQHTKMTGDYQNKKPRKVSQAELQAEQWAAYIRGCGKRPKRCTPTLISESKAEPARNKPLVWGKCEGMETKVFLDSGAEVNVIDSCFLRKLQSFSNSSIKFIPSNGAMVCANGSKLHTSGTAYIRTVVGENRGVLKFTVANEIFPKVIIGIRGMKMLEIQLDPAKDRILVGNGKVVPLISKVESQSSCSGN
jgi:hypothetical protein